VSISVYNRSAIGKGKRGGLRSYKTCLTLPHLCVPVPSQEPLSMVVLVSYLFIVFYVLVKYLCQ